jgi:uncharacterized membrane protein
MRNLKKILGIVVILLGLANVAVGITFVTIGATKQAFLHDTMNAEQITLGISDSQIAQGDVIDTAGEAQIAGDIVRSHRHEIAPTYGDLLGGEKFNPGDPKQLTYGQALNLENYLYLAVASFGLTTMAIGAGVAMLLTGIALVILGVAAFFWRRKAEPGAA